MADMASGNFLGARGSTRIPLRWGQCKRPVNVNQEVEVTVTVLPPEERSGIGRVVWCEQQHRQLWSTRIPLRLLRYDCESRMRRALFRSWMLGRSW